MDTNTFLTYFNDKRVSAFTLKPMQYDWTIPFFPDSWTIEMSDRVLLLMVAIAMPLFIIGFFRLYNDEIPTSSQKKGAVMMVLSLAMILTFISGRAGVGGSRESLYLVETEATSPIDGFYSFDVLEETAQTYEIQSKTHEIRATGDAQSTEEFDPFAMSVSKSDATITKLIDYDDDTTLGEYRDFIVQMKTFLSDL